MKVHPIVAPLFTVFLAIGACAPMPPTLPVVTPDAPAGADAQVVFYDYTTAADGPGAISITFDDGRGPRDAGRDLKVREFSFASTPIYPTSNAGVLRVTVTLTRDGHEAATESVELPLKTDWRWGVAIRADAQNPREPCIGCMGVEVTPISPALRRADGENLYLIWSGASIRSPGVY